MRVETGVRAGDTISPYYDPMIAKLVVHAADRRSALTALVEALKATEIAGSIANVPFLAALASDVDFAAGDVDTGLIGRKQEQLIALPAPLDRTVALAALSASGAGETAKGADPWSNLAGYAHFQATPRLARVRFGESEIVARVSARRDGQYAVALGKEAGAEPVPTSLPHLQQDKHGGRQPRVARWPGHVTVFEGGNAFTFSVPDPLARAADAAGGGDSMRAPMPGLVKIVRVAAGETVTKGQPLLVLEAMKMEHTIAAPHDGIVSEIVPEAAQVTEGTVLVRFAEAEAAA